MKELIELEEKMKEFIELEEIVMKANPDFDMDEFIKWSFETEDDYEKFAFYRYKAKKRGLYSIAI